MRGDHPFRTVDDDSIDESSAIGSDNPQLGLVFDESACCYRI